MNNNITVQKGTTPLWVDETGMQIPVNRITKIERLKERHAASIYKKSIGIHESLKAFKADVTKMCQEVYDLAMAEANNADSKSKGNFMWYNFDRSIQVQVKIAERIEFDDLLIKACQDKLAQYINENVTSTDPLIPQLINDAFSTTKGKLDSKKVMSLLRYRSRVKNPLFEEAMKHLEDSIRRPESKAYFMVSVRNEEGKYENIDLNFSSVH